MFGVGLCTFLQRDVVTPALHLLLYSIVWWQKTFTCYVEQGKVVILITRKKS